MTKPAKSILVIIGIIVALFIPTYIAIGSYLTAQYAPVTQSSITMLEITDPKGNVFTLPANDASAAKDIGGFIKINDNASKITSLPEQLVGVDHYEFKYYSYARTRTYKYYFTPDASSAYYVDANGKVFHIAAEDASSFLSTEYARCLYNTTDFPKMTVSGEVMTPVTGEWAYKTFGGDFVALDNIEQAPKSDQIYQMKGAFALSFDNEPDFLNVTIRDNDTIVFNGPYEEIVNTSLEGMTVDVEVKAEWYNSESDACYGAALYEFRAKVLFPAVFYLGETEIEPGEFVVISAKNVDDLSAVSFASEPDLGFTPTFFADGKYARALVPVPMEYEGSSVKFICSYGEVTQEMTLDITKKNFKSVTLDISATIVSQTRTETTIKNFNDTMAPIVAETESVPLWDGLFIEALNSNINTGFGLKRTISATGQVYRHQGVDYVAVAGKEVMATNSGKVVYVGYLDLPGHMVVIDHGLGLKSWYCHLGSAAVKVGDVVNKGDVVGFAGSTGFTINPFPHIGLSVYDVPVCPYSLWEEGIIMTK